MARRPVPTPGAWPKVDGSDTEALADALAAFPLAAGLADYLQRQGNRRSRRSDVLEFPGGARSSPLAPYVAAMPQDTIMSLDLTALTLLQQCAIRGGLRRDEVVADGGVEPAHVDRAARRLVLAGLAGLDGDRLRVTPAINELVPVPFPLLGQHIDGYTSEELGRACSLLGLRVVSNRKADRARAIMELFGDPGRVRGVLDALPPDAHDLFGRIVVASLTGSTPPDEDDDPYDLDEVPGSVDLYDIVDDRLTVVRRARYQRASANPVDHLTQRLLVGEAPWSSRVWPWYELLVAFEPSLAVQVRAAPATPTRDLDGGADRPLEVVAAALTLLDAVAAEALEGKKTGDREPGTRVVRACAKAAGVDATLAVLVVEALRGLGLIVPFLGPRQGRGRNATQAVVWRPHPARRRAFEALSAPAQWQHLVHAWRCQPADTPAAGIRDAQRTLLLASLASLPTGQGVAAGELAAWLAGQHLAFTLDPACVDDIVAELVALGLCPPGVTVGLTAAARAALGATGDTQAVEELLGGDHEGFVVQPDHTVVAPPNLAPGVRVVLRRMAEVVSEGGATVWRISPARLTELGARHDAEEIVAFLAEHSRDAVPDNVVRLVRDAMGGSTRLEVRETTTVVHSTDAATLADAARLKRAKLEVIAPGVAISPLAASQVMAALRGKGVAVVARGETPGSGSPGRGGTAGPADGTETEAPTWAVPHPEPSDDLATLWPGPVEPVRLGELAGRLVAGKRR